MLPPVLPSSLSRPGPLKLHDELPPITPLAMEAEDNGAGWWRGDRPAAARAPVTSAASAAAGGASASILDALLATMGEGSGQGLAHNPVSLPPVLLPADPPAGQARPGAPRRHAAPLPPPPEIPSSVLAALRPASAPPAPAMGQRAGHDGLPDTAASAPAPGTVEAAAEDALLQAMAWMEHICQRSQSSALP